MDYAVRGMDSTKDLGTTIFDFMRLPPELRHVVYHHLEADTTRHLRYPFGRTSKDWEKGAPRALDTDNLAFTCRNLREEVHQRFTWGNTSVTLKISSISACKARLDLVERNREMTQNGGQPESPADTRFFPKVLASEPTFFHIKYFMRRNEIYTTWLLHLLDAIETEANPIGAEVIFYADHSIKPYVDQHPDEVAQDPAAGSPEFDNLLSVWIIISLRLCISFKLVGFPREKAQELMTRLRNAEGQRIEALAVCGHELRKMAVAQEGNYDDWILEQVDASKEGGESSRDGNDDSSDGDDDLSSGHGESADVSDASGEGQGTGSDEDGNDRDGDEYD